MHESRNYTLYDYMFRRYNVRPLVNTQGFRKNKTNKFDAPLKYPIIHEKTTPVKVRLDSKLLQYATASPCTSTYVRHTLIDVSIFHSTNHLRLQRGDSFEVVMLHCQRRTVMSNGIIHKMVWPASRTKSCIM